MIYFSGSCGCGLYVNFSSTDTRFVKEIWVDKIQLHYHIEYLHCPLLAASVKRSEKPARLGQSHTVHTLILCLTGPPSQGVENTVPL